MRVGPALLPQDIAVERDRGQAADVIEGVAAHLRRRSARRACRAGRRRRGRRSAHCGRHRIRACRTSSTASAADSRPAASASSSLALLRSAAARSRLAAALDVTRNVLEARRHVGGEAGHARRSSSRVADVEEHACRRRRAQAMALGAHLQAVLASSCRR